MYNLTRHEICVLRVSHVAVDVKGYFACISTHMLKQLWILILSLNIRIQILNPPGLGPKAIIKPLGGPREKPHPPLNLPP